MTEGLLTEVSEKRKECCRCGNPSGRRPNFIGRQHLTFDKGRAWMPEVERQKFCRTQNKQSVHKARVKAIFDGQCGFGGVGARQSWWCGNPSGRRPNFIGRQHLTFDKGGKCGGARRGCVVLLQWLWEWSGSVQREEQAHSPTNSEWDSSKAKPYKHTQTISVRKVSGIVRFWRGWCEARLVKYFTAWALIIIGLSTE